MKISVVIATRDRAELLRKTLLSLANQSFPKSEFEVLVCNHGSTDHTVEVCRSFETVLDLRVIDVPFEGYSIQRPKNAGIYLARHELVVILDCGIICPPQFLTAHRESYENNQRVFTSGPVYGIECDEEDEFWRALDPSACPTSFTPTKMLTDLRLEMLSTSRHAPWLLCWGCNFSARKEDLIHIGAYDESFVGWGWDDTDVAIGLHRLGLSFVFPLSAWCFHYPHPRRPFAERAEQNLQNWIRTYKKYPMPELELEEASGFQDYDLNIQRLISTLQSREQDIPRISSFLEGNHLNNHGRLLFWGFRDDLDPDSNLRVVSPLGQRDRENSLYSFGLRTPFDDGAFDQVIMSSYWRFLTASLSSGRRRALYYILKEACRVGSHVILDELDRVDEEAFKILLEEKAQLEQEGIRRDAFILRGRK